MLKILIADDEIWIRNGIVSKLEKMIFNVQILPIASNGYEAMEYAKLYSPDIVITDIRMPGMDGLELAKQLKTHLPETELVIISGFADFEYAQDAIKTGVTDYLLKPVKREELLAAMTKCVKNLDLKQTAVFAPKTGSSINTKERIEEYIQRHLNENISRDAISRHLNLTPSYFSALFRKLFNQGFSNYITSQRIERAKLLLNIPEMNIIEVSINTGFNDTQYFYKVFKKYTGMTPSQYREQSMKK